MTNTKEKKIKDQELLNNPLYSTFVVNPIIHKKMKTQILILLIMIVINTIKIITMTDTEITIDIAVTVEITLRIIIDLILDKDITIHLEVHINSIRKLLQTKNSSRSPYRSPHRNNSDYRYNSRSRYRSRSQSQGNSFRRYNYPYRSPSRPRNFRSRSRTPSQNRQQNRINQVDVKSTNDKDSSKFEIHTCQEIEIANTITPYSWFYPLYVHTSETKENLLPSKLEILFLLDTGASISVLNLPTFHVISKQLNLNVPKTIEKKELKLSQLQIKLKYQYYIIFQ